MTRARERLIVSATEPYRVPDEPSWWARIEGRVPLQARSPAAPLHLAGDRRAIQERVLPRWTAALLPASITGPASTVDGGDDEVRRLGLAVHRVLEWAAARPEAARELAQLADAAALEFDAPPGEVARLAGHIWHSPACAPFFRGARLRWAGNEVAVAESGDVLRIDRLVALEEDGVRVWWVLDYKLRHAPAELVAYREQMARYVRAVQALQPDDAVRAAFITGAGTVVEL